MRSEGVIFGPPSLNLPASILQRKEPVQVQTFIPKAPVERLNIWVVSRFSGPGEVQGHPVVVGPLVQCLGDKLTAIVDLDPSRRLADPTGKLFHDPGYIRPFDRRIDMDRQTFPTKIIHYS